MAEFKLGRIKFVYQGTWQPSTSYVVDDVVTVGGKTYICVISNTSSSLFATDLNNITPYWNLVADGSRWAGTWTNATYYQLGDQVQYGGIVYQCTTPHTSASSTATLTATAFTVSTGTATLTYNTQVVQPFLVGSTITLAGFSPTSTSGTVNTVNTTFTVVSCSTTQVTFALTGTYTAGTLGTVSGTSQLGLEKDQSNWVAFAQNINWIAGGWTANTRYKARDLVTYGGYTYLCNTAHVSASTIALGLENNQGNWDTFNAGIIYQGTWATSTRYRINDVVTYGADLWICTTQHTSTGTTLDNTKFSVFVNGFEFQNSWSSTTNYIVGDTVTYGGYTYTAIQNGLNQIPSTQTAYWQPFTTGFSFQGDWSSANSYKVGSVVRNDGYTYLAIADNGPVSVSATATTNSSVTFVANYPSGNAMTYVSGTVPSIGAVISGTNIPTGTYIVSGTSPNFILSQSLNPPAGGYNNVTTTAVSNTITVSSTTNLPVGIPVSFAGSVGSSLLSTTATYYVLLVLSSTSIVISTSVGGSQFTVGTATGLSLTLTASPRPPYATYWSQLNSGLKWNPTQGTYTGVTQSSTSGGGSSAQFTVLAKNTTYSVTVTTAGSGYALNDTIKILGSSLGGISPANDLTLTVTSVSTGGIVQVSVTGISSTWSTGTTYVSGDVVLWGVSSYICILAHVAASGSRPDNDTTGTYWNLLASGTEQAVLTTTGDMFYYGANGPTRLPIGTDGQVLRVNNNVPAWQYYGQINNIVFVSTNGADVITNGQGTTIDKPWASIRFACQQVEDGYLNTNAKTLLRINKQFLMKETNNYVLNQYSVNVTSTSGTTITVGGSNNAAQVTTANLYQGMPIAFTTSSGNIGAGTTYWVATIPSSSTFTVATSYALATQASPSLFTVGTGTTNVGSYVYNASKTERDAGLIITGFIHDISRGGTYATITNLNSFFSNGSLISGVNNYDIPPFVYSENYLANTLIPAVLNNTAPIKNYQTLNGVSSGSQGVQQINTAYTAESGVTTKISTLVSYITSALTAGTNVGSPTAITPNTTISIKTGTYNEILPINVPSYTALVGDELRSTVVQPYAADPQLATVVPKTVTAMTRIKSLIPNLIANTSITPTSGNTVAQVRSLPAGSTGSTVAITNLQNSFNVLYELVASGLGGEPTIVMPQPTNYNTSSLTNIAYATTTGSNSTGITTGYGYAVAQIQQNYKFLITDTLQYITNNYSITLPALGERDIRYILDSVLYDLTYGGNTQSLVAGSAYYSLYQLQITSGQVAGFTAGLGRLKSIINLVSQGLSVASNGGVTSGNVVTQTTAGSPGSSAAGGFAQDRIQNVINWINNASADNTVTPYISGASSALQTAYSSITALTSNIASDATVWVSKYYQSVTFANSSLINRDATLIVNALAYDMVLGTNFNAIQAGRAFNRANTSATNLRATSSGELSPTLGAINFMYYKMKNIAASGAVAQIQTTIDDLTNYLQGGAAPMAITWSQPGLPLATYTGVTAASVTGGGDGTAAFTITRASNGNGYYNYQITVTTPGASYTTSSKLRIYGDSIGGQRSTNDIVINVTQVNSGAIQVVTYSDTEATLGLFESNRAFLLAESIAYFNTNYSSLLTNPAYSVAKANRDMSYILDAVHYDMNYGGNWASQNAGMAYYSALYGSEITSGFTSAFAATIGYVSTLAQSVVVGTTVASPLQGTVTQVLPTTSGYVGSSRDTGRIGTLLTLVTNFVSNGLTSGALTATITTIASGTTFTTSAAHGLVVGDIIIPQTSSNGLVSTIIGSGTPYYVVSVPTTSTFTLATSYNGSAITSFTSGTSLSIAIQTINMPYVSWASSQALAAYATTSAAIPTYQTSVVNYINTNYPALTYNTTYAQRDTNNVTLAAMLDAVLGSNYASIQAGRAYNRTQDYQVQGYELTATTASMYYLSSLIATTLASYSTQATSAGNSVQLIVNYLNQGQYATPQVNGTTTYNDNLGIINGAEILRANIPFLAAEVVAYYAANFGGTVSSITTSVINTSANHNLNVNDPVVFSGTSAGGITTNTVYYVLTTPSTTSFTITTSEGYLNANTGSSGTAVTLTAVPSPTMTVNYYHVATGVNSTTSDITYYLNAIIKDLEYTGNYRTLRAAQVLLNAVNGSAKSNMWLVRNACGVRNMTMNGLTGILPSTLNSFGTKRPTGGAYTSLDPGFGPNDTNAWVYSRSCYVQNCTMFGYAVIGAKVDGALHAGGNRSMVANDYTCIIGDGLGWQTTGAGSLSELVSVFNYYSYAGYLAELGGRIRATNGNSSYGTYGVVAEGVDTTETPIFGTLNNRYNPAQITNTVTDAVSAVLRLEYANAGSTYTNAVTTVAGSGYNTAVTADEFRDAAVFETRLIDTGTTSQSSVGGTSYITATNTSQGGATGYITIAATDTTLSNAYNNMRVQLLAGTGVGQYANVLTYTNGTKVAQVIKDSFTPILITSSSTTVFNTASTASLYAGMPIYLSATYAGLTGSVTSGVTSAATLYYVQSTNFTSTAFSVYTSATGGVTSLTAVSGATVTVTATATTNNLITATNSLSAGQGITFSSSFNGIDAGTIYYVLALNLSSSAFSVSTYPNGPAVTITATGSASSTGTTGVVAFAAGWDHVVAGTTIQNTLDLTTGYIIEPHISYSAPGYTATGRTITSGAYSGVTYGAGSFVAVSSNGSATAYSSNGTTWTAGGGLGSSTTWTNVVYGGGQGVKATPVVGGFGGTGAVLQAVIGTGSTATQIVSITVVQGGYNYTTPPTIVITGGNGSGCTATCTVLNGAIQTVTVSINGSGYTGTPTVSAVTGIVSSVTMNSWGKNYYTLGNISVTFSQPQGINPTAFALNTSVTAGQYIQTAAGRIYYVASTGITSASTTPTFDYTSATYNGVANGTATLNYVATQAQGTAVLTNNGISSITLSQAGYGYTSVPSITIADSGAFFATVSSSTNAVAYASPTGISGSWLTSTSYASNQSLRWIAYGGGTFVAVGGASGTGIALASNTPNTLTLKGAITSLSGSAYYSSVAYGAGVFVAISTGSSTVTSYTPNNSANWYSAGALPSSSASWASVAFGNNRFVALASNGYIALQFITALGTASSSAWTTVPNCVGTSTSILSSSLTWTNISYGEGVFLATASGSTTCATSPDGINWTLHVMPSSTNWSGSAFGVLNNVSSSVIGAQPLWVAVSSSSGTAAASIRTGVTTAGRMKAFGGSITEIRLVEPGSGYAKGNVTATTSSTNLITVDDTTNLSTSLANNQPIEFNLVGSGGLTTNTTYYVIGSSVTSTQFQVTANAGSTTPVTLSTTSPTGMIYTAGPVVTQIDPNHVTTAGVRVRMGDGALANPTFTNRGTNNATATSTTTGDGYGDLYQNASYVNVAGLYSIPQPGANVQFATITGSAQWYKLVSITNQLGNAGNYTATFQINPAMTTLLAPTHSTLITTRLKYSQVRLTGHDFLYIGTGNQTQTNYPYVIAANAIQANQELNTGGGRTFFTSTDQDGNFNVGNLFGVQQSTGTATLNASAFNLAGLQSLTLGAVSLGVGSATITQFSTDPYFTANSDNILPTQKAIKAYITAQIGGGSSSLNVNTITSGQIYIANNTISNTAGNQIYVSSKMTFTGGIDGAPVALAFFSTR
jgi:hypothetical protein